MARTIITLLVLLIVIGAGVSVYLIMSKRSVAPPQQQNPSGTLEGQAIFTDGEHGFSIQYPDTYKTDYTFTTFYHLPAYWRSDADPDATGTPVIAIIGYRTQSDNSYPRYYTAEVRIGVSRDPKELARCENAATDHGETAQPDVTIGGATFKVFAFQSAAAMQYLRGVSYRTIHNGTCYAIERLATGSNYRDDPPSEQDISDETLMRSYDALDSVVQTFRFSGS